VGPIVRVRLRRIEPNQDSSFKEVSNGEEGDEAFDRETTEEEEEEEEEEGRSEDEDAEDISGPLLGRVVNSVAGGSISFDF